MCLMHACPLHLEDREVSTTISLSAASSSMLLPIPLLSRVDLVFLHAGLVDQARPAPVFELRGNQGHRDSGAEGQGARHSDAEGRQGFAILGAHTETQQEEEEEGKKGEESTRPPSSATTTTSTTTIVTTQARAVPVRRCGEW